ncbi:hypothetical protein GCM10009836_66000 [Pseudonocardia ailaonensis]|uniref:PAS domain S-box-containing protein/diguanylate cyclase (GGDEF)-like protein n=1 Tax=Pseudonocardia ailaonensis TaxID=367279 RepID=A0ABN2NMV7_9PSEU
MSESGERADPVRRTDFRRARHDRPTPDAARFAGQVARALAAPSGGEVPGGAGQGQGHRSASHPEYAAEPVEDANGEISTDPSAVRLVAPPGEAERPDVTDPGSVGVPSALRDAAFGTPYVPESGDQPGGVEVVPLPTAPAVVCDLEDRILRVNPAFLRLTGCDPSDPDSGPLGMRLAQLVAGPDADARLIRADGAAVRVRVVRWDLPGGLRAVLLVELGEPAPEPVDRRWTAELERLARVGTWTFDLATATLRRSASLEELYRQVGVVPDGAHGPVEGDQVALLCRALRTGAGAATDHHVELRLPGERVLSCRAVIERAPHGMPVRLAGMVRDVSAQRLAEGRVQHSGRRFADLMSTVPAGVALLDAAGRLVDANASFCRLLDRTLEGLRGTPALALSAEPVEPGAPLPGWLRAGGAPAVVTLLKADGSGVTCEIGVTTSTSDEGDPFWLVVATDVGDRRRAAEVLRQAGSVDELTRLPNRAAALALVDELLADSPRVAVACGDLDDFARVNSSLGHLAGDELLVGLAGRLQRELPIGCTAARLSADEFVVICSDHALIGGPDALARRVGELLHTTVPVHGRPVQLTASVGVATPDVRPGEVTAGDLLRYAEVAMQEAKRRDRGGVATASPAVVASADRQLELEAELRAALAEDRLVLEYQPVVGPDGTVLSAEALVRWPHPERGMISPGEFLPVAERAGMMRELDLWVLRTAVNSAVRWPGRAGVAVNLAGLLPGDPAFLSDVTRIVEGAGLAWERLILELVETSLVALPQAALDAMAELVSRGARFAVDDFGTGYSSLARLKELPAQTVKVDRAFVTGVGTDPADFAVARAVVDMARAMGRTTVAEGVETAAQFHVLRGLGVDAYQGWLFSRSLREQDLEQVLAAGRLATPARALGA